MVNRSEKFKELYEEYQKLKITTHIEVQILKPGQSYNARYIKLDDLMHRKELAREIVSHYKDYFEVKPTEWFDLERDTA